MRYSWKQASRNLKKTEAMHYQFGGVSIAGDGLWHLVHWSLV